MKRTLLTSRFFKILLTLATVHLTFAAYAGPPSPVSCADVAQGVDKILSPALLDSPALKERVAWIRVERSRIGKEFTNETWNDQFNARHVELINKALRHEATDREIAELQAMKKFAFKQKNGTDENIRFTRLPIGIPGKYISGYEAIRKFFRTKEAVFERIQDLEVEVLVVARTKGVGKEFEALQEVLAAREQRNGFKEVIEISESLNTSEWLAMLRNGALFHDKGLADTTQRSGQTHGQETHRIQWNILMREMEENPIAYKNISPVEYYKTLGDIGVNQGLDWRNTGRSGGNSFWSPFFDSVELNFSSPEYLRRQHDFFPLLGDWF